MIEVLGEPLSTVAYILLLYQVPFLLQFVFGKFSDKIKPAGPIMLGVLIFAAGLVSMLFVSSLAALALAAGIAYPRLLGKHATPARV